MCKTSSSALGGKQSVLQRTLGVGWLGGGSATPKLPLWGAWGRCSLGFKGIRWLKRSHKKIFSFYSNYNVILLWGTMSSSQDSEVSSQGCAAEVFHPATGWCQWSGERPISRQNESERAGILLNGLLAKQAQLWSAGAICTSSALKAFSSECLLAERVRMGANS